MTSAAGLFLAAFLVAPVPDFTLSGSDGARVSLSAYSGGRPVIIVFLGVECPLANLYAPRLREIARRFESAGVKVLMADANRHDDAAAVAAFAREHRLPFPSLLDPEARAADALGARRTPEAFLLDARRRVRYRGRIDDQYEAGGRAKARPGREDLVEAVLDLLAGRPVRIPATPTTGCLIGRPKARPAATALTFSRDVAPILRQHCVACHTPGDAAPFPLLTFADARKHADTIAEVVAEGRMPPWHASPRHGRFRNDRSLSAEQKKVIGEWVERGCPEGPPLEPLPSSTASVEWAIGRPDAVYAIPEPFAVPPRGVIEYQHFLVKTDLKADAWVVAAEIRPGNRRVVHHCSVFLHPPGATGREGLFETGTLGSANLIAWTPGSGPTTFPPGMAKRLPAGWQLHFVIHYTPVGTPQRDRTELALRFCDPLAVKHEVATKLLQDADLAIPPHAPRHVVEKTWQAPRDVLLMAMLPHMHLRGRSFRYEAEYPDGRREVLLDVPAYDFNWQHRYELIEPKRLPAGTVVRCTAVFDNSAANAANPNPNVAVKAGTQSWDEMFNGYFDIALAEQDIASEFVQYERRRKLWTGLKVAGLALVLAWGLRFWGWKRGRPCAVENRASVGA